MLFLEWTPTLSLIWTMYVRTCFFLIFYYENLIYTNWVGPMFRFILCKKESYDVDQMNKLVFGRGKTCKCHFDRTKWCGQWCISWAPQFAALVAIVMAYISLHIFYLGLTNWRLVSISPQHRTSVKPMNSYYSTLSVRYSRSSNLVSWNANSKLFVALHSLPLLLVVNIM